MARSDGNGERTPRCKNQKGNTSPRTVHCHSLCEADWGEWWIIHTLYMAWRDGASWKCTRGHCQCTGLGCIRREGARGVLVKVGVEKVVWTDLVWGEDGRSGVGGGGGTWQASNWGGRSRQFSYSLLLPALLNAELLVSYIKRVHCTLRNAHYKRVS